MDMSENGRDLIPEWWDLPLEVKTLGDIHFLGKVAIKQMIESWQYSLTVERDHQIRVKGMYALLGSDSAKLFKDRIAELAKNYEDVEFSPDQIGIPGDNWANDPEPLDELSKQRGSDATTFNRCGWCKYASGGLGRYQCHITTGCGFLTNAKLSEPDAPTNALRYIYSDLVELSKDDRLVTPEGKVSICQELRKMEAFHPGIVKYYEPERRFYTPCFLPFADDELMQSMRLGMERTIELSKANETSYVTVIDLLGMLHAAALDKPALPNHRPYDWFNIGDRVMCYIGNWDGNSEYHKVTDLEWVGGVVADGYRHHDGMVSVLYDTQVHDNYEYENNGHGGGYGMSRPEIMKQSEFDYLTDIKNETFTKLWVRCVGKHMTDYDPDSYLQKLLSKSGHV